jgi:hypothetical protein
MLRAAVRACVSALCQVSWRSGWPDTALGNSATSLDADAVAGVRVGPPGDVAGGEDARRARRQAGIDSHAALDREAGGAGQRDRRLDADTDEHRVGRQFAAVGQAHDERVTARLDRGRGDAHAHVDAFCAVQCQHARADRFGHGPAEQARRPFDDGDRAVARTRRRRDLQADEAAADDDQARTRHEARRERGGVVEGAQAEHAGQVGPRDRQPAQRAAGGQQQRFVAEAATVGESDLARRRVDRLDAVDEMGDGLGRVVLGRTQGTLRGAAFAGEQGLGQRRAFVGQVRLGADEHDRPGPAELAQGLRSPTADVAGSDDHHGAVVFHERGGCDEGRARRPGARGLDSRKTPPVLQTNF